MIGRKTLLLLSIGTIIAVTADNKCNNPNDISSWSTNGGSINRPTHSNYCSRTYNGGCFLNADCIESCFHEEYGYSEECSSCFGKIPQCSINRKVRVCIDVLSCVFVWLTCSHKICLLPLNLVCLYLTTFANHMH